MLDVKKLKYDLAIQSALATTILNRDSTISVPKQIMQEFSNAYREYSLMSREEITAVKTSIFDSEQLAFELANSLVQSDR